MFCKLTLKDLGFSLLEMSFVLMIIATLAGSSLLMTAQFEASKAKQTDVAMDAVEAALVNFVKVYKRLPCPAVPTLAETDANFGIESCTIFSTATRTQPASGSLPTYLINFTNYYTERVSPHNTRIYSGAVPVKTLGLPNNFMLDGWSNKFHYIVSGPLADPQFEYHFSTTNMGLLIIRNQLGGYYTDNAAYALISAGPNGFGAFSKGTSSSFPAATISYEISNSYYIGGGGSYDIYYPIGAGYSTLNAAGEKIYFDDIVRYKTKATLVANTGKVFANPVCLRAKYILSLNGADKLCYEFSRPTDINCPQVAKMLAKEIYDRCLNE